MDCGVKIYRSNSSEKLLAVLSELVRDPVGSPFEPECIVVQSNGMATWLSMNLSRYFGVWCNPDFPHPRQLIQRILRAALGEEGEQSKKFGRERLVFAILGLLPEVLDRKSFKPLQNYLADDPDNVKILQLAKHIAYVFDQYSIYRPDMVLAWETGEASVEITADNSWQPELWRGLIERLGIKSPASLLRDALEKLHNEKLLHPEQLPKRISLFGIASLPPVYLGLLAALSRRFSVHFFLLSPSAEYWSEIRSQKEINRMLLQSSTGSEGISDHYLETGNQMLASLGGLGRDFQRLVEESIEYYDEPAGDLYDDKYPPQSMLETLQHDMLHLVHRRADPAVCPPQPLKPDDYSIEIHACHSRLRELEVLHDKLLELLTEETAIPPRNVVVMAPDIEMYAPLIEAVFERRGNDLRTIPYRIADRPVTVESPVIDAFFRIFYLAGKRVKASEVMDLLSVQSVHKRFGIGSADLEQIHRWIDESGIRWGIDENDRANHDQPKDRQNTWAFGLDRLVLGYAMPGRGLAVFNGIAPYDEVEGQTANLLGCFMGFCEIFFEQLKILSTSRPLSAWQTVVVEMLDGFFVQEAEENRQLQKIRDAMVALVDDAGAAGFDQDIDSETLRKFLKERLESTSGSHGFIEGGVTFCAMLPMRSIPFQVVCMLGMNDGEFPRVQYPVGFDLVSQYPRLGDRSGRNDDRYLFLEALLAARKKLLISYVGMSIKDGALLPPAIVVNELIGCLADSFILPNEETDRDAEDYKEKIFNRLVVKHPLQPFSPRYFAHDENDPRLFSYAENYCDAARLRQAGPVKKPPFFSGTLSAIDQECGVVFLNDLQQFFNLPARWFLQKRLGLYLSERDDELRDREPVNLTKLDEYLIATRLINQGGLKDKFQELLLLRGQGLLPLGVSGGICFDQIQEAVESVSAAKNGLTGSAGLENLAVNRKLLNNTGINGELAGRYDVGLIRMTAGRLAAKFYLSAWLEHLYLCVEKPADQELRTYLFGKGEKGGVDMVRFAPVDNAENILIELVDLFWLGQRQPLLFFAKSSYKFACTLKNGQGDEQQRLKKARSQARGVYHFGAPFAKMAPEGEDPYLKQLFGDDDPVTPNYSLRQSGLCPQDFESLAVRVFDPLVQHLEKVW